MLGKQKISILHACTEEGHGIRFKNTLAFESFDMSLRKKKHLNVQNEYLRKRLLEVDDFLDVHYIFRSEKKYQGWLGKLIAILDRDETEELASKRSGEKWSGDDVFIGRFGCVFDCSGFRCVWGLSKITSGRRLYKRKESQ